MITRVLILFVFLLPFISYANKPFRNNFEENLLNDTFFKEMDSLFENMHFNKTVHNNVNPPFLQDFGRSPQMNHPNHQHHPNHPNFNVSFSSDDEFSHKMKQHFHRFKHCGVGLRIFSLLVVILVGVLLFFVLFKCMRRCCVKIREKRQARRQNREAARALEHVRMASSMSSFHQGQNYYPYGVPVPMMPHYPMNPDPRNYNFVPYGVPINNGHAQEMQPTNFNIPPQYYNPGYGQNFVNGMHNVNLERDQQNFQNPNEVRRENPYPRV